MWEWFQEGKKPDMPKKRWTGHTGRRDSRGQRDLGKHTEWGKISASGSVLKKLWKRKIQQEGNPDEFRMEIWSDPGEDNWLNVSMICDITGVPRFGYYRWVNSTGGRAEREKKDKEDFELVLKAYSQRGYNKGTQHTVLETGGCNEFKANKASDG